MDVYPLGNLKALYQYKWSEGSPAWPGAGMVPGVGAPPLGEWTWPSQRPGSQTYTLTVCYRKSNWFQSEAEKENRERPNPPQIIHPKLAAKSPRVKRETLWTQKNVFPKSPRCDLTVISIHSGRSSKQSQTAKYMRTKGIFIRKKRDLIMKHTKINCF